MLSQHAKAVIESFNRGYRVINGKLYNSDGEELSTYHYKGKKEKIGYLSFGIKIDKKRITIFVHKLVAYQKFGIAALLPGVQVRHLDNNSLNNVDENISLGDQSKNMLDRPKEERVSIAAKANLKHDHEAIKTFYNEHRSYKKTMERFNISSKGTLNYILRSGETVTH